MEILFRSYRYNWLYGSPNGGYFAFQSASAPRFDAAITQAKARVRKRPVRGPGNETEVGGRCESNRVFNEPVNWTPFVSLSRELLAKSEVFEKHPATTVEESGDFTDQDYNCVYPVRGLSRLACEWQRLSLLKLQAYRILVDDGGCLGGLRKSSCKKPVKSSEQSLKGSNATKAHLDGTCENAEFQTRTRGKLSLRKVSRTMRNQPTSPETRAANMSMESYRRTTARRN